MSDDLTVPFGGEDFPIAEKIGLMPLMKFAKTAKAGADTQDLEGLVAMYDLLEQCIAPAEWDHFVDVANRERADGEQLMAVVGQVMQVLSQGRPTQRSSDSSDGPMSTPENSGGDSSSVVVERLEEQGRPDLALVVEMARSA